MANFAMSRRPTFALIVSVVVFCFAVAAHARTDGDDAAIPGQFGTANNYVKVIGGAIAGLGALFGLPVTILTIRKTKAEIRKLELEATQIENDVNRLRSDEEGPRVVIQDSRDVQVTITTDPRLRGPLLLLLDFIFAWIVITLAGFAIGVFLRGILGTSLLLLVAAILLVPLAREARRVKRVLSEKPLEADKRAA